LAAYSREQLDEWSQLILEYLHAQGESPASSVRQALVPTIPYAQVDRLLAELVAASKVRARITRVTYTNIRMRPPVTYTMRVYSRVDKPASRRRAERA